MAESRLEKSWKSLLKEYEAPSYAKKYILEPLFSKQDYLEPILDAGCGTGFFSNLLSEKGYQVISIDKNLDETQLHSYMKVKSDIESFNPVKMIIGDVLLINILSCLEPKKRLAVLKK
ncbi:class I SAM-dependent methyltransferase [Candidatus Pacearchaeota archaeon]|nr:class I SAM-dependent methyltransferase [Candidatus Pacearchaeota archaeon]